MPRLTDEQWLKSLNALRGITSCFSHVEAHKKVVYRWYLTPHRLNKIYCTVNPKCWRCGTHDGHMTHIWWECEAIKPLWTQVQALLNTIANETHLLSPMIALLLLFPDTWRLETRKIASLIILAARNLLALHWKDTYCPTNKELIDKVYQYYQYEVLSSDSYVKTRKLEELWKPWLALNYHRKSKGRGVVHD
ncbi:Hypothetical predicted protein [Pelobates cultripes]|uniref:Reverse transcriptase zinc-binding domain-containing protein n=1 Tax=Pelobates cultripes TaxID=61616 RepID=A0AAD1SDQ3_PELCU|nr:Hypothetical predicted protein [Pelobates cultripes]